MVAYGSTVSVVGETWESTFPVRNSFDTTFGGPGPDEWGAYHSGDGFVARITDRADWTIMVYSTGDSDLESWALTYLAQLEAQNLQGLPGGRQVRIMMLLDRSDVDSGMDYSGAAVPSTGANWSDTRRAEVVYNSNYSIDNPFASAFVPANLQQAELNMGDPQTLVNFTQWAMSYAPAQQYGLIFWGHGYGWQGTQFDSNDGSAPPTTDPLTMPELHSALASIAKLDLVVMDSCLMQQAEVATEFSGEADYVVASEQTRVAGRINYDKWLPTLKSLPNISAKSLAQEIVSKDSNEYVSGLDMSKVGAFNAAIETFALAATTLANATDLQHLQVAIASATVFETTTSRDVKQYMQAIVADTAINATIRSQATGVISALGNLVLPGYKGGGGLAIYLPENAASLDGSYGAATLQFCNIASGPPGTRWADFLRKMLGAPDAVVPASDVGNTANTATTVTVNASGTPVTVESDIGSSDAGDFYKFTGLSGDSLYIQAVGAGVGGLKPVLTLYGPDKTTVLARVTADANGRAVLNQYSVTQSGDYYVSITPGTHQAPVQGSPGILPNALVNDSGLYTLSLRRGTAVAMRPHLTVSDTLAFGNIALGSTATATLTLSNTGGTPLTVTALNLTDSRYFDPSRAPQVLPVTIWPGASMSLTAFVAPVGAGSISSTLHILSDDPTQPDRAVTFSANVVDTVTAYDQYLLELINRGRADPTAEAARMGVTLNEGLAAGTITTTAKQPLVLNAELSIAAQGHSQWMLDTDTFSHTGLGGSTPTSRMGAAGYDFIAPWGTGENIALRYSSGAIDLTTATAAMHKDLFVDDGYDGRGHRINLMTDAFKEVGLGVLTGLWGTNHAAIDTEDFAYQSGSSFLTGVAFADSVIDDDFYSIGEGLAGVSVQATRTSDNAVFTATTGNAGGYAMQLAAGTYNIVASGGGLTQAITYSAVVIGSQNVKRDFILQQAATPGEITVLSGATSIIDGQAAAVSLGSVVQNGAALTATFTVRNDGGQPLTLGAVTLPAGFTLTEGLSTSIAAGASDTFTVQLGTATVGTFSGQLSFTNNDANENPFNFPISGEVTALATGPEITVLAGQSTLTDGQSSAFNLGTVVQGGAALTATFTVRNDGDQTLTLGAVTLPAGFTLSEGLSASIAAGASDTFTVRLGSATVGVFSGQLSFSNNDSNESPFNFPISGTVTSAPIGPEIAVLVGQTAILDGQGTAIDFGSVVVSATGPTLTFTVRNDGDASLTLTSVSFPSGYTLVENLSSPLAPGASDNLILQLDTTTAGVYSGNVTIVNGDADESPFTFPITGTVTAPVGTDAYEPDNTPYNASVIATDGTPQTHSISPVGDTDFVKFSPQERSDVVIGTNGSAGDTRIWLYGPDTPYVLIDSDDDSGPGYFSLIQRTGTNALVFPRFYSDGGWILPISLYPPRRLSWQIVIS